MFVYKNLNVKKSHNIVSDELLVLEHDLLACEDRCLAPGGEGFPGSRHCCLHLILGCQWHPGHNLHQQQDLYHFQYCKMVNLHKKGKSTVRPQHMMELTSVKLRYDLISTPNLQSRHTKKYSIRPAAGDGNVPHGNKS